MSQGSGGGGGRRFVVVGGGVAGVTAVEELLEAMEEDDHVTLITASPVLKTFGLMHLYAPNMYMDQVGKKVQITRNLEDVEIVEKDASHFKQAPNLTIVQSAVLAMDTPNHTITCTGGAKHQYDKCLLACGAVPKLAIDHPNVVGIRDTETVEDLRRRMAKARRVVVLGNGGIALEVIHEVLHCELVWVVKDDYIGNTFFDASATAFIMPELKKVRDVHLVEATTMPPSRRKQQQKGIGVGAAAAPLESSPSPPAPPLPSATHTYGQAMAFFWAKGLRPPDKARGDGRGEPLTIIYGAELEAVQDPSGGSGGGGGISAGTAREGEEPWPMVVTLTNGQAIGCDFVISATGVVPAVSFLGPEFTRGPCGGVVVNEHMQTTASPDVYAAGDCCSMNWPESDVWFQMRLWNQARAMAMYAVKCMVSEGVDELGSGIAFELFTHMTKFFGKKVVLLGCFNAQHLHSEELEQVVKEVVVQPDGSVEVKPSLITRQGGGSPDTMDQEGGDGGEQPSLPHPQQEVEMLTRVTPGEEYIKLVLVGGRVKGAMLVGDTDLAETFENLILNQLDVSSYGINLLDPDIDIEDYFD